MRTVVARPLSMLALLLLAGAGPAFAQATPPSLVNYQGVLRDGAGAPKNGSFEMVFRFFNASGGGSEILLDQHCAVAGPAVCTAETGAVTVTSGLFSTQLGGGTVVDGAGAGVYASLAEAFRDFSEVWMQIEIFEPGGGVFQVLAPRVRVLSAAYSLNADHLDGQTAAFFLDSSAGAQTKAGPLTLRNSLTVDSVPGGTTTVLTETGLDRSDPAIVSFNVQNSGAGTAQLLVDGNVAWHAGNDGLGSGLDADLLDGSSSANFINTSATSQTKAGNLTVLDLTLSGDNLLFSSPGAGLFSNPSSLQVSGGDLSTDDLILRAVAGSNFDGSITLSGLGPIQIMAGDGTYFFYNAGGGIPTAGLDALGNLQLDGDLDVDGETITFGSPGASIAASAPSLMLTGGDLSTDDLILRAASTSLLDGSITILGDSTMSFVAGNGSYSWFDSGNVERAHLLSNGDLQFDGELIANGLGESQVWGTLHVGGDLLVDGAKAFVQNHPHRRDLAVVYNALEGDESGTYTRGSARLTGGEARVALGETFAWTTSPEIGLTAHVTPRGGWSDLYVVSVTTGELVVRSRDGADADFDYVVYGLRIGYEDAPIVQNRKHEAKVPAEGFWSALYESQPDLRGFSPRSRFQKMRGEGDGVVAAEDKAAARALRQGIGEKQPSPGSLVGGDGAFTEAVDAAPATPREGTVAPARGGDAAGTAGIPMDSHGNVYARSFRPSAGDLASMVQVTEPVAAGDVLVIDPGQPGRMSLARASEDTAVFGVVAGEPGVVLGSVPPGEGARPGTSVPVALSGIVLCKVDAGYGAIRPGDLLTTSATPGHAGRVDSPRPGTILGKALESLQTGTGLIRVLVTLR